LPGDTAGPILSPVQRTPETDVFLRQEDLLMMGLGWQELVIVLVIVMIIFGAGKLPEVAKSLGQGVKEFKQESSAPDSLAAASAPGGDSFGTVSSTQASERQTVRADDI
jgi:sec-independent protein translocase protein TatA